MEMNPSQKFEQVEKILQGLELAYPEDHAISRVRFALETLTFDPGNRDQYISNFFSLLKCIGDFPVTPSLKALVLAGSSHEKLRSLLNLLDHLNYSPDYRNMYGLLRHLDPIEGADRHIEGLTLQWLTDLESHHKNGVYSHTKSLLLEGDSFVLIKKLCDFYHKLYPTHAFVQLKKAYEHHVSLNSPQQFFGWLHHYYQKRLFINIQGLAYEYGLEMIEDAFSKGQIQSKLWALQALKGLGLPSFPGRILLLCGWVGVMARLLFDRYDNIIVVSVDRDPKCSDVSKFINATDLDQGRFLPLTADIFDLDYNSFLNTGLLPKNTDFPRSFDLVINTSCEHISDFRGWYEMIPEGQLVLLQSNDYFTVEDHVNCVPDLDSFKEMAPMQELLFSGELPLKNYRRFMLIGRK